MKNIFLMIALIAIVLTANFAKASDSLSGNTLTSFGTYQLTPSLKSVVIDNVTYKTWELTYSGSNEKYQLIAVPGKDGKSSYKVLGKNLEIMYKIGSDNFGGNYIEPELRSVPLKTAGKKISEKQLKEQKVNTLPMKPEEYMGLVACFMPRLIN
jgi:hypothetical protein